MSSLCEFFERTRQAFYQHAQQRLQTELCHKKILAEVRAIRCRQPRVGVRKLHRMIKERLHAEGIEVGRDRLFALLRAQNLLIRRRRYGKQTTDSRHGLKKHGNQIRDLKLTRPNQVYVADITYLATRAGFCYLALITDAFSRKIVGYDLSLSLSLEGSLRALEMALSRLQGPLNLIHHSDRGIQYCSHAYVALLTKRGVRISMTEEQHVYENALAERVNGILKDEFLLNEVLVSYEVAQKLVAEAIRIYNEERLHLNLAYQTPATVHAAQ